MIERPWCCPEPRCTPVHAINWPTESRSTGESFECFGKMEMPVAFSYDGVEHKNDLNHCSYTPLKGVLRWHENADDWRAMINGYSRALKAIGEWPGYGAPTHDQ